MKLELTPDEIQLIFKVLGEMPAKYGTYPLMVKIKLQAEAQNDSATQSDN